MSIRTMIIAAAMLISPAAATAATQAEAQNALAEAEALRAGEFAPEHFNSAKQLLKQGNFDSAAGSANEAA